MADDPAVLAVVVVVPVLLGLLLRGKGAVLAALGLGVTAVVLAADRGADAAELTGAAILGAGGGLALGLAGALMRRALRRRRRAPDG